MALPDFDPPTVARGPVTAASTLYLADGADGWILRVNGRRVQPEAALGWAQSFRVDSDGPAELRHETSSGSRWSIVSLIVLWLGTLVLTPLVCLRRRAGAAPHEAPGGGPGDQPEER